MLLLWACLFAGRVVASTVHVESALRAVPVTLAGTLEPASLSVNGRPLVGEGGKAKALLLNGVPVDAPDSAIFLRTSLDRLKLEWDMEEGGKRPLAALSYPAIVSFEISPFRAIIQVNEETRTLLLDGKDVPLEGKRAEFQHASDPLWLERPHVVELQSQEGGSRIYNLEPSFREDVLSDRRAALGTITSPNGGGRGYVAWLEKAWPDRKALSLGLGYANHTDETGTAGAPSSQIQTLIFYVRGGYRPLYPGDGWLDFRRLEIGLVAEGFINSVSVDGGQAPADLPHTFAGLGLYLHLEPVRVGHWGLAVHLSAFPIRFLRPFDYASASQGVELGYHW